MLASSVSICGVSAAIATCGVIRGDNKKLSYIISLVLVCAVPMMYVMPWLAGLLLPTVVANPETVQEVAGAWMGGTIDTTGAVVASGALLGETAEQTASSSSRRRTSCWVSRRSSFRCIGLTRDRRNVSAPACG